jgi:hypothetical protein
MQDRQNVCDAMQDEMVGCSITAFVEHYLPFKPFDNHVAACVQKLKLADKIELRQTTDLWNQNLSWTDFPSDKPPSKRTEAEKWVFRPLVEIASTIGSVEGSDRGAARFRHEQRPDHRFKSETPGSSHKTGGYICPVASADEDLAMANVAVHFEFRKNVGDSTMDGVGEQNVASVPPCNNMSLLEQREDCQCSQSCYER